MAHGGRRQRGRPRQGRRCGIATPTDTFVERLVKHADERPDDSALRFVVDGGADEVAMTYRGLDDACRSLAVELAAIAPPGSRALLLAPPGFDFVVAYYGCLYAGVVAVPAYLPDPANLARTLPRLHAIADDADVACVVAPAEIIALREHLIDSASVLAATPWVEVDATRTDHAPGWVRPGIDASTLAMLQYTSGSTAQPKGVALSHANLLANSAAISGYFQGGERPVLCWWLPPYHDMGLIGFLLQTVYGGWLGVGMSPVDFLRRPRLWLEAISRHGATATASPNFGYELCVRKVPPDQRVGLDLRTLTTAVVGGDPVRPGTLRRFAEAFEPSGFSPTAFRPSFGLAEATLVVAASRPGEAAVVQSFDRVALEAGVATLTATGASNAQELVSSGAPIADHEVRIVDPQVLATMPDGYVGEIWIRGPSVGSRYWGRARETTVTFGALTDDGDGPFLRTGDLGFLLDGRLFVTGRTKDLLILRGRNVHPQDIEAAAEHAHAALRPGGSAAFAVAGPDDEEEVVLVAEVDSAAHRDGAVRAVVEGALAETGVGLAAVVLIAPRTLPKTSSGKIQRHATKSAFLKSELDVVESWAAPTSTRHG